MGASDSRLKKAYNLVFPEPRVVELFESKDEDEELEKRRRNSLQGAITEWVDAYEKEKVDDLLKKRVKKPMVTSKDPRHAKATKTAEGIAQGDMRRLREQVIGHSNQINKKYATLGEDTLLHLICREGYVKMVEFLIDYFEKNGQNIPEKIQWNAENEKRRTPLHVLFTPPHETYCGWKFGVTDGIPNSKKPDVQIDADWIRPGTPEDRHRILQFLVKNGADPTKPDFHGYTPLHFACSYGWLSAVDFLLSRRNVRADNSTTNDGANAVMIASQFRHAHVVEFLVDTTQVPLEAKNLQGETALHYAVTSEALDVVEILCQFGANPDAISYNDETPFFRACQLNNAAIVNVLLDYHAEKNDKALDLLTGDAKDIVLQKILLDKQRQQQQQHDVAKTIPSLPSRHPRSSLGHWVPYRDKQGRGIFYYNTVSRLSQFDVPPDYKKDPCYVIKDATFGLHFYH